MLMRVVELHQREVGKAKHSICTLVVLVYFFWGRASLQPTKKKVAASNANPTPQLGQYTQSFSVRMCVLHWRRSDAQVGQALCGGHRAGGMDQQDVLQALG